MAPVNRRKFIAGLIAAPVLVAFMPPAAYRPDPEIASQFTLMRPITDGFGEGYETPNGEPITAIQDVHGRLYVFTALSETLQRVAA